MCELDDRHHLETLLLKFLNGRELSLTSLLPVQAYRHPRQGSAGGFNHGNNLAHRGSCSNHIVNYQDPAFQRRAYHHPAFSVALGFFAVVGEGHIHAVLIRQRHCGYRRQGNPLIGWPKQYIKLYPGLNDPIGITATQCRQGPAAGEGSGIEEIGTDSPRFERIFAEFQHLVFTGKFNKFSLVSVHGTIEPSVMA